MSVRRQFLWAEWRTVSSGCCVYASLPLKNSLYCFELTGTDLTCPLSTASDSLSSTPAAQSTTLQLNISNASSRANLTRDPLATFSSQPAHTGQVSTRLRSESLTTAAMQRATTTGRPLTSAAGQGPARPTHKEVSSELNVGDEGELTDW